MDHQEAALIYFQLCEMYQSLHPAAPKNSLTIIKTLPLPVILHFTSLIKQDIKNYNTIPQI